MSSNFWSSVILPRWRKIAFFLMLLGIIGVIVWMVMISRYQAQTWLYPIRTPVDTTPAAVGIDQWEVIEFRSSDGLLLHGWFIPADSDSGATVILIHGLSNNRRELLDRAAVLHENGYHTLLFDLRGHGESEGSFTTLGINEAHDVRGAVEYLKTRAEVNPEKIAVHGQSLGAVTALHATAEIPEIRAVIAESAFLLQESWQQIISEMLGLPPSPLTPWFMDQETGVALQSVDLREDLTKFGLRPVMFIHGSQDSIVDVRDSEMMYKAASDPKELYIVEGAGHGDIHMINPPEYYAHVIAFLDKHLH